MEYLIQLSWSQWSIFFLSIITSVVIGLMAINALAIILLFVFNKNKRKTPSEIAEWPKVTIHIPIYNEMRVIRRLLDACLNLDYPREKLQIMILDDSTDKTKDITREFGERYPDLIKVIHRKKRTGFKAGALNMAMKVTTDEFVATFDADTVPPKDFIKKILPYFYGGEKVGFVQANIEFINKNSSWMTKVISLATKGYYVIEQAARYYSGLFASSFGTSVIFRRQAINDAGGWHSDTLAEDIDLSFRIQMKGWKGVFVPEVKCLGEVPPLFSIFKMQEYRWSKGYMQCLKKFLKLFFRNNEVPMIQRIEAILNLSYVLIYPVAIFGLFLNLISLFLMPQAFLVTFWSNPNATLLIGLSITTIAAPTILYLLTAIEEKDRQYIKYVPVLGTLWCGVSISNAKAVIDAIMGKTSSFLRTPKFGVIDGIDKRYLLKYKPKLTWRLVESTAALVVLYSAFFALESGLTWLALGFAVYGIAWMYSSFMS